MLRDEEGRELVREQQPPTPNDQPAVWPMVIADMQQRDSDGIAKYGTPLQPFNGRKPLVDLYQELLDAVVYCRQEIEERAAGEAAGNGDPIVGLLTVERDGWKSNWYDLNTRFRHIKAERDEARSELETARQVIASNGQALCKLQAEKDEAWRQIDALTEERDAAKKAEADADSDATTQCDLKLEAIRKADALAAERDDLAKQLAEARAGLVTVTEERDQIALKLDLTLAELDAVRKELSQAKAERDEIGELLGMAYEDHANELAAVRGERDGWKVDAEKYKYEWEVCRHSLIDWMEKAATEATNKNKAIAERDRLLGQLSKACDDANATIGTLTRERDEARKLLASAAAQRDGLTKKLDEFHEKLVPLAKDRDAAREESDRRYRALLERDEEIAELEGELAAFRKVVQVIADPPK